MADDIDPRDPEEIPVYDFTTKRGRALARHRISEIDLEIAHLQETKAELRAKLADAKG